MPDHRLNLVTALERLRADQCTILNQHLTVTSSGADWGRDLRRMLLVDEIEAVKTALADHDADTASAGA